MQGLTGRSTQKEIYAIVAGMPSSRLFHLKGCPPAINRQQEFYQLPRHRNGCHVTITATKNFGVDFGKQRIPLRCNVGRFDKHCLEMAVAFL